MQMRRLGGLWPVSALTLGGGGLGQLWGATSRAEAVATVRAAVDTGITLLDLAPLYGDGEAERVVGEAFQGRLPDGIRVTTKFDLGNPQPAKLEGKVRGSLENSLRDLRLDHVDLLIPHSMLAPDDYGFPEDPAVRPATWWHTYTEYLRPLLVELVQEGLIGAWGLNGIGLPQSVIRAVEDDPAPTAIMCISNLLDSAGGLRRYDGPEQPRQFIAAANACGVGVLGVRAVQAGALTDALDRTLPDTHPEMRDYRRAEPFRELARELGQTPAALAHRYALTMPGVDTVVLGVKNRTELAECIAAEEAGPLAPEIIDRIDECVGRAPSS